MVEGKTDSKGSETGSKQNSSVDVRPYGARLALAQLTWCYKSGEILVPLAAFQTDWLAAFQLQEENKSAASATCCPPGCCGVKEQLSSFLLRLVGASAGTCVEKYSRAAHPTGMPAAFPDHRTMSSSPSQPFQDRCSSEGPGPGLHVEKQNR